MFEKFAKLFIFLEETIGNNKVLYWSPGSSRIAFLKTNDTNVKSIEFSK